MSALLLRLEKVAPNTLLLLLDGIYGPCRIKVDATFSKAAEIMSVALGGDHSSVPQLRKAVIALVDSVTETPGVTFSLRLFNASIHPTPDESSEIQPPLISENEWSEKSKRDKQIIVLGSIQKQMACNGKEFADMLGISTSHMCNLLLGKRDITWRVVHKLHSDFPLSQKMREVIKELV